ncbi:DUF4139 domain-containing protein [uncultured Apibacter sp.]|uniref:DUF4139 domain-containing protein n=1 Tax=uncultured Apibacter sp. TaxID=1778616 RepID=UPI0025FCA409|nr:DUF4139 domain-containing protein [uncultured Apibacter sp.]
MKNFILISLFISTLGYGQNIFTTGKVKAATVYFNVAEISQEAGVSLSSGTTEVVIDNVANSIYEETVQISAPPYVTVVSVQYTTDYGKEYNKETPEIRRISDSIILVKKQIEKLNLEKNSYVKTIELLDKNKATYDKMDGGESKIDVNALIKLVEYYNSKRLEINDKIFTIDKQKEKLSDLLGELDKKSKINPDKNENKKSTGKLIIQLLSTQEVKTTLKIKYLTNNASWYPIYDLRASDTSKPIDLYYKAMISQNTGIDWNGVKLTLSSGIPNQNNQAPILKTWRLDYINNRYANSVHSGFSKSISRESRSASQSMSSIQSISADYEEANFEQKTVDAVINENQLSISFEVDALYTILSNGKQHSVVLTETKIPAFYKHYSVPKLDMDSYLIAEIKEYSKYNFLTGEANIIFDGVYVGKTIIDPNQTSEILNLSMGKDKRVSIKREKVSELSTTKFLSSYKEQIFTYDITIRNNKKEEIDLQLKDQYPVSSHKEITVELLQSDKASNNEELGVLTWTLKLKPNETKKIRVSYKVKYPKDKQINL